MTAELSLLQIARRPGSEATLREHLARQVSQKTDEVLFGGPAGGSMSEATNAVAPQSVSFGELHAAIKQIEAIAREPVLTQWATPDFKRLAKTIQERYGRYPVSDTAPEIATMELYGIAVIEDDELPSDVLAEARDQHGNSLGRVMAS